MTSFAPGPAAGSRTALVLVENLSVPTDRRVWLESRSLRDAGWNVVVVCPKGRDRDRRDYELLEGVEIHRFDLRPAESGPAGYVREYASAMRSMLTTTRRLARTRDFDVVHACNPPDGLLLAALPLRRRGAAFIFDHHDLVPELYATRFGGRRTPLARATLLVERLSFALADVVLATNESYRRVALERGRKRPERVFVVRNAPDLDRFRPGTPDPGLKRGRAHLLAYVGVLGPQDGGDVAIRALGQLLRRRSDWHAVFAGDGDGLPELRQLTSDLGLGEHVEFVGWVGDREIETILSTADVCLSPEPPTPLNQASTMIKVAEYLAMERPVVAFDLPETRYTAADAAVYAPANDEAAFAACIDELLDDSSRRAKMGTTGRARLEGGLSWRHSEQVLLEAYECAVEAAASRRRGTEAAMSIAIVVLTHNRLELLRECVENVLARTSSETREIVVWDNASTDGTRAFLDSLTDPRIRVVHHPRNIGQNGYAEAFAATELRVHGRARRRRDRRSAGLGSDLARRVPSAPRDWLPCSRSR